MANEKRLIDANDLWHKTFVCDEVAEVRKFIENAPTVDAVEVVRCKDCRWAKPYERIDGKTGYCCHFCGHSFKYGTSFERVFSPVKDSDDFCSYGERRTNE